MLHILRFAKPCLVQRLGKKVNHFLNIRPPKRPGTPKITPHSKMTVKDGCKMKGEYAVGQLYPLNPHLSLSLHPEIHHLPKVRL